MCETCWREYGSPQIINPLIRRAEKLIARVYEHGSVGGNLHIVIDDWNIEDEHIKFCIKHFNDYKPNYKKDF